jgi:hypothetical protein
MIFCCLVVFSGCFSPNTKRIIDVPAHLAFPTVRSIKADGDILRISIVQDGKVVFISGIEPVLIDGDIYLSTIAISSVVRATEFSIDMSDLRYPKDWRNRLYWIEQDSISSPINPFIAHYREIKRSKITLQ